MRVKKIAPKWRYFQSLKVDVGLAGSRGTLIKYHRRVQVPIGPHQLLNYTNHLT
jgi:hypothetical protein